MIEHHANQGLPFVPRASNRRVVLACVLPALVLPFFASLVYFVWLGDSRFGNVVYVVTKVFTIAWPVVAVFWIERRTAAIRPIDWRGHLRALPLGGLTGLVIGGFILAGYAFTPLGDYAAEFGVVIREELASRGIVGPAAYILLCLFLAIAHSLIEEFYWRWYVFGSLVRVWPLGVSYFVAGLAFAAHHYVSLGCYFSFFGAFVFGTCVGIGGAFWCWLYRRQGTLAGAWLSHALADAAIFAVGYDLMFGG